MYILLYTKFIDAGVILMVTNCVVQAFVVDDNSVFQSTVAFFGSKQRRRKFDKSSTFPILHRLSLSALDRTTVVISQSLKSITVQRLETFFS